MLERPRRRGLAKLRLCGKRGELPGDAQSRARSGHDQAPQRERLHQRAVQLPMTFDDVRRLAITLPRVVEGTSHRTPAFRVGKKFLARLNEDGVTIALR